MIIVKQSILFGLLLAGINHRLFIQPVVAQTEAIQTVVIPDRLYNVQNQDPKYPLKTRISKDIEKQLIKLFTFTETDKSRLNKLRAILQPLADRNDPVALYWLAKTYDLYEFGMGDERDAIVALKYYTKAADLGMATTEYFLSTVYKYGLLGFPKNERQVISYLDRAKLHGDNEVKVEVLLDYARLYSPDRDRTDFTFVPRNAQKMAESLRAAYALDPNNTTIADWWGSELEKLKQYSAALDVYWHSSNPNTHKRIAAMYENGRGTKIDIPAALMWYKKIAVQELKDSEYPNSLIYLRSGAVSDIYRLVCQRKISPPAASPYFDRQAYQKYLQHSRDNQVQKKLKTNPCVLGSVG